MSNPDMLIVEKGDVAPSYEASYSSKDDKWHFEALSMINESVVSVPVALGTGHTSDDATEPPRYTDPLVIGRYDDVDNINHRREVCKRDPVMWALTFGVCKDALNDGWRYVKQYGDDEEAPGAEAIHADFEECHAKFWLVQAAIWASIHGDSLLYTGEEPFRTDIVNAPGRDSALDMFSKEYFELPTTGTAPDGTPFRDSMNRPNIVKITPNPENESDKRYIPYDQFIHVMFDQNGRDYAGIPRIYNIWPYVTLIRHTSYNIGWAYQKFGMGAIVVFLAGRLTAESKASLEKAMKNIGAQRAGVLDANLIDRIEYIGPEGSIANNAPDVVNLFLGMAATGSRFPKTMLSGDSTGQISAGDVQDKNYAGSLDTQIQKPMEPFIRDLARRRGHSTDWKVEFNARYAKDEREDAEIDLLRAHAEASRAASEFKVKFQGFGGEEQEAQKGPKDQKKNQNPAGVQ